MTADWRGAHQSHLLWLCTGDPQDDEATAKLMKDLVAWAGNPMSGATDHSSVVPVCHKYASPWHMLTTLLLCRCTKCDRLGRLLTVFLLSPRVARGFDEKNMFRWNRQSEEPYGNSALQQVLNSQEDMAALREEFFDRFHNISRIMDCVGCQKCRLWGKVQVLGLGTAIKILLGSEADMTDKGSFAFTRNEVIALVNTAHQLAKSVDAVDTWPEVELDEKIHAWTVSAATLLLVMGVAWGIWAQCMLGYRGKKAKGKADKGKAEKEALSKVE